MNGLVVTLVLTATAIGVSLFFLAYAIAIAPSGDPARLGLRGVKRRRALADNALWAAIEPAVRWVGRRVRGLISDAQVAAIDLHITRAGDFLGMVPEELVALSVVAGAAGALVGAVVTYLTHGAHLVFFACTALGSILPAMALSGTATERGDAVARRLPSAIDLLALAMGAGLDFPAAIRQVVEKAGTTSDPLIEELALILQSLKIGRTRKQALEQFAHRVPRRSVLEFTGAVIQAELRGTPVANVLVLQAETARLQRSVNAEVAASKAGVKLVFPLGLIFLCVLLVIVAPMVIRLQNG